MKLASSCSCSLPENCFGRSGFHFEVADESYCWAPRFRESLHRTSNDEETIISCNCTRQRTNGNEMMEAAAPHCIYRGKPFAYEMCPPYWRKAKPTRTIDPNHRMRFLPVEFKKRNADREIAGR